MTFGGFLYNNMKKLSKTQSKTKKSASQKGGRKRGARKTRKMRRTKT